MTGITRFRGRNMRCTHADSRHAVMTTFASTQHFSMIHSGHWQPGRGNVTGITLIRGTQVSVWFVGRDHTIMTTLTSATSFIVIHNGGWHPGR